MIPGAVIGRDAELDSELLGGVLEDAARDAPGRVLGIFEELRARLWAEKFGIRSRSCSASASSARISAWTFSRAPTIEGIAGSPGIVEGPARVIVDVKQLVDVQQGEILVAPFTSTSWTPVFGRIAATPAE
jgi:hypothetical protein